MTYYNTTHKELTLYTEDGQEFEIEVEINIIPGEKPTYYDPGYPSELEIVDIVSPDFPVDISWNEMWSLIYEYQKTKENAIWTMLDEEKRQTEIDYA